MLIKRIVPQVRLSLAFIFTVFCAQTLAFDSGSTGVDGVFAPTQSIELELPPDGIFNFTEVSIPRDVVVTFRKNQANTPVTILVSGDFNLSGTVSVDGGSSPVDENTPVPLSESIIDQRGEGGAGGFDGGIGGTVFSRRGGSGSGPGGGIGATDALLTPFGGVSPNCGGGAGSYATSGSDGITNAEFASCRQDDSDRTSGTAGRTYGIETLQPLIGGSGGGGGSAGQFFSGSGGGGGGGAILVAVSGTFAMEFPGRITANGGRSGGHRFSINFGNGISGGGGSGGAIRIVATTIERGGRLEAIGGGPIFTPFRRGGTGGDGRVRLEAEQNLFSINNSDPTFSSGAPQPLFLPSLPQLRISRVENIDIPAVLDGTEDFQLPADLSRARVELSGVGIPLGAVAQVTNISGRERPISVFSSEFAGEVSNSTASAFVSLAPGSNNLSAQVVITLTIALGEEMSRFARGERVERIVFGAGLDGSNETMLITVSGKEYRYEGDARPLRNVIQAAS